VEEASTGQGSKVESLNVEGQGAEDGGRKTEDEDQGTGGVEPKPQPDNQQPATQQPIPAAREPEVKEIVQALEAGK
jgi:hypothetical protein